MTQGSLFDLDPADRMKPPSDDPRLLKVLITVKAAPNPSSTYGETVCVAGLSMDPDYPGWLRLYPINFRYLEQDIRFRKYDIVTVRAVPARTDGRIESWRPQIDTLKVERNLRPWSPRRPWLDPVIEDSMCQLNGGARERVTSPSLALVRAADVGTFELEPHPGWSPSEQAKIDGYVNQLTLFGSDDRTALEAPRFRGYYRWRCHDQSCRGHRQGLLDWEFVALQRRLANRDDAVTMTELRRKFFDDMCTPTRDVAFYVGNQAKRPQTFSVLGVYYPPRSIGRQPEGAGHYS